MECNAERSWKNPHRTLIVLFVFFVLFHFYGPLIEVHNFKLHHSLPADFRFHMVPHHISSNKTPLVEPHHLLLLNATVSENWSPCGLVLDRVFSETHTQLHILRTMKNIDVGGFESTPPPLRPQSVRKIPCKVVGDAVNAVVGEVECKMLRKVQHINLTILHLPFIQRTSCVEPLHRDIVYPHSRQ